jgi:polyhydroxyalkanoate synthesis repressor PhaR
MSHNYADRDVKLDYPVLEQEQLYQGDPVVNQPRTVRKYPNRRLYDLEERRYIDLGEIREMVTSGVDLIVIDRRTGTDVTSSVLLQVIIALEQGGGRLLSSELMLEIIRSHEQAPQTLTASYLEQSLNLLKEYDQQCATAHAAAYEPAEQIAQRLAQMHYQRWRAAKDEIYCKLTS